MEVVSAPSNPNGDVGDVVDTINFSSHTIFPLLSPPLRCMFSSYYLVSGVRTFAVEATKVPSLGDSITEGTIVKFEKSQTHNQTHQTQHTQRDNNNNKHTRDNILTLCFAVVVFIDVGDYVEADGVLVVIETDKVSVDIRSAVAGVVKSHLVQAGETVKVGQAVAEVDTDGAKPAAAAAAAPKPAAAAAAPKAAAAPAAAPAAAAPAPAAKAAPKAAAAPVAAPVAGTRNERKVPMTRMRQTIANRLKAAQNTAACLTTFNEIDMTNIMEVKTKTKQNALHIEMCRHACVCFCLVLC